MIAVGMAVIRVIGWVPFALLGCGRLGFDPTVDAAVGADSIDAPTATLIPLCDRVTNAIYCNDFEGGGLRGASNQGAQLVPAGGLGGSAGFLVTAAPGQMPHLGFTLPATITTGEIHVGGRLFLAPGPESANFVVVAQVISPAFEKVSFDINNFDRVQLVNSVDGGGRQGPNNGFPRGRWACFELVLVVAPAGSGGRVEVLIDEASALAGFDQNATLPAAGWFRVELGTLSSNMNTATESITFDNWIISTQSIGCP
jgi:hypothetical protein